MKTFTVSISRMAKGKAGYQRNKYQFGWSFHPERHTIQSLIRLAAVDGYSFLAGEFDRKPPSFYGRTNANTARISENFRQTCIVPLDDDGEASNAVDFWENDKLFQTFGGGYYHSSSSTPEKPKLRILFELDQSITDRALYQEIRYSFGWYYPRIDILPQIPQVWYGSATPKEYKVLGNVLPFEVLERVVLLPYRQLKRREAEAQKHLPRYSPKNGGDDVGRILGWLANRRSGDNRNLCLLWASGQLKKLGESWATIGDDIVNATIRNGYFNEYAKSNSEIERIFSRGIAT